jgi:radical SAM superfamily enzyme YgiQ (UPF0313 family)
MILIHPPLAKPCEPPAGIARLAGTLDCIERPLSVVDANLDGILRALNGPVHAKDTWTRRAKRNLQSSLDYIRSGKSGWDSSRYTRAVMDIHRILGKSLESAGVRVSLSDYQDENLSPMKSSDLIRAAEEPENNPFYPHFRHWLVPHASVVQDGYAGFSLNFLSQALTAFSMIGFLRKIDPNAKIILGGGLVTSWLKRPGWRNPFGGLVDAIVAGPGEDYLRTLFGMKDCAMHIKPDYGIFPLRDYLSPGFILPYSASSGCYWRKCLFCPEKAEENPYSPSSVGCVLDDLVSLIGMHRPVMVHFLDNAMSPSLLRGLIAKPLNTPWYGFVRMTDHFKDPDFCFGLRKSGCVMLKIGIESGDQGVLDALQKGIDLETASVSLKNIKNAGIGTYLYFLFGTPSEGPLEALHTLDFVKRHSDAIDFLNLAIFNMPINDPDGEKYNARNIYEGDLSLYSNFEHPKGWNRDKVRSFMDNEFKTEPAIRNIIRRNPPFFSSNHAAFFLHRSNA